MKDEFFEKILNVVEGRPFITDVSGKGMEFETIAQISEGDDGELKVTLQSDPGPRLGSDDAEATITLPMASEFGFTLFPSDIIGAQDGRRVPLHTAYSRPFSYGTGESERVIDGRSISLADPVRAKTLSLWYEGIRAEGWDTNSDEQAITISHGDLDLTKIPPHGTTEFFVAITNPSPGEHPIEWDIGDTHQGVIVRTDKDNPVIKITIAPADDRDITWDDYIARIEVGRGDLEIEDVTLHVWRKDEAEIGLEEIEAVNEVISYGLSFMNSAWCRPKVAIAWGETWSDSVWRGTWTPVWGAWQATRPARRNRPKNWMPIDTKAEKALEQVLRNITGDHYPVIQRYLHNAMAMDRGDWASSVTASVAILQRIAKKTGWKGVAKHLRTIKVDRPYHFVGGVRKPNGSWRKENPMTTW